MSATFTPNQPRESAHEDAAKENEAICHLLRLPKELRDKIHVDYMSSFTASDLYVPHRPNIAKIRNRVPLLQVCKQTQAEASEAHYLRLRELFTEHQVEFVDQFNEGARLRNQGAAREAWEMRPQDAIMSLQDARDMRNMLNIASKSARQEGQPMEAWAIRADKNSMGKDEIFAKVESEQVLGASWRKVVLEALARLWRRHVRM